MWSVDIVPAQAMETTIGQQQLKQCLLLFIMLVLDTIAYLFCSEECLWVELRVSFVDGQWNDSPLAHIIPPAVTVGKVTRPFSLPPFLVPPTSSHYVPPHQCHPLCICGCGSCKKPPQPRSIVLLHLLYVLVLQPERMEGGLVKVRRKGGEGA